MELKYSAAPKNEGKAVRGMGRNFNISFKDAIIICDKLRGMKLPAAMSLLADVAELKASIPYRTFRRGMGHRRGLGKNALGKYPEKAASHILGLLKNVSANAEFKGLDPESLKIVHIQAQRGVCRKRKKPKGRYGVWITELIDVQLIAEESK